MDDRALGESLAKFDQAEFSALLFEDGYCRGGGMQWGQGFSHAHTRLGEPTQQVRLIRCDGASPRLWAATTATDVSKRACRDSELRLPTRKLETPTIPPSWNEALETLRESMPDQSRWSILLPLTPDGDGGWVGGA